MKPIYVFAILAVLFVLYTKSNSSSTLANNTLALQTAQAQEAAAAAQAQYGDSTAGIIGASVGAVNSVDWSEFGI